jgi:hypothetical protein
MQRILIVGQRLDAMRSPQRGPLIEAAAAGMIVGRNVLRLRDLIEADRLAPASLAAAREALAKLRHLSRDPTGCARHLDQAAERVLADAPAPDRLRLAAQLHIASLLIDAHASVFDRALELDDLGVPVRIAA